MNKDELNMDRIFREKLEGHSIEPPSHLWDGVRGQMATLRRKKRIAYLSRFAAAAVIVLAFLAGWYFNEKSENIIPETTQNNITEKKSERAVKPEILPEEKIELKDKIDASPDSPAKPVEKNETQKTFDTETPVAVEIPGEYEIEDLQERIWLEPLGYLEANLKNSYFKTGNLREKTGKKPEISNAERALIAENVRSKPEISEKEAGWKMGVNVAPGYSSHTSGYATSYAQNMTYAETEADGNISGGISVQYKTKSRWSVESGIYYAQNTQASINTPQLFALSENSNADQMFSPSAGERYYFNTALKVAGNQAIMNSAAGVIEFSDLPVGSEIAANLEASDSYANALLTSGEFSQVFDFVEVPFYLRYLLIDAGFDIELIGGVNAGLVVGNNAFMKNEDGTQNIGKTKDISSLNMSGTFGVGVNYSLGKHISLGVEPRISYYLNSINNNPAVEYRPYRIGIYTGLYYEF